VALARALAVDPDILLMDEPFAALDAITREALQVELARIHAATGKTTLFVTHSIEEAVYLADEVVAVSGKPGRLAAAIPIPTPRPRSHATAAVADMAARLRVELMPPPSA
jgi:NitT/TauT family transport system ATP-binding protein